MCGPGIRYVVTHDATKMRSDSAAGQGFGERKSNAASARPLNATAVGCQHERPKGGPKRLCASRSKSSVTVRSGLRNNLARLMFGTVPEVVTI